MATPTDSNQHAPQFIPLLTDQPRPVPRPAAPPRRGRGKVALAVVALALAGAAGVAVKSGVLHAGKAAPSTPLYHVVRTSLPITIDARGTMESGKSVDIVNRVEGQTVILYIIPDGSIVKKGDLLCELDSATTREKLVTERITIQQAEADVAAAVKTREVAEFALREYEGGTYPQTRQNAEIDLKTAETNLDQAANRFGWSSEMHAKGLIARSQMIADRDAKMNGEITLARTKGQIHVLEDYTRRKKVIELTAAVQKARSDELSKQAKLALEESKLRKYEAIVEHSKLTAPIGGLVIHANDAMRRFSATQEPIQEGTAVRENQTLLRIPDVSQMRVEAKLDESVVSRAAPGQPVRIRVDALSGLELRGRVATVQTMADPINRDVPEVRFYSATITVEGATPAVRPGMAAKVEILASEAQGVIAVPMKAVLQAHGETFVYVGGAGGAMLRRGVRLGAGNDELIEVVEGLGEGEIVSLDPMAVMTKAEKREAFSAIDAPSGDEWR